MRNGDINELLGEINNTKEDILKEYNSIKEDFEVKALVRVKVKFCLENLRSCLDYLANDIYDVLYSESKNDKKIKIYFPYGRSENDFKSMLGSSFPKLKDKNELVFDKLESVQPYKCNSDCIVDLCTVTNTMKHDHILEHDRVNSALIRYKDMNVLRAAGGMEKMNISVGSFTINGKKLKNGLVIKDGVIQEAPDEEEILILKNSNFYFKDTNIDILKLINESYIIIKQLEKEVYSIILKTEIANGIKK